MSAKLGWRRSILEVIKTRCFVVEPQVCCKQCCNEGSFFELARINVFFQEPLRKLRNLSVILEIKHWKSNL